MILNLFRIQIFCSAPAIWPDTNLESVLDGFYCFSIVLSKPNLNISFNLIEKKKIWLIENIKNKKKLEILETNEVKVAEKTDVKDSDSLSKNIDEFKRKLEERRNKRS